MKNNSHKLLMIIIATTFIIAGLFYLSDINFQLDRFIWRNFIATLTMIILPVTLSTVVTMCMSRKALKSRSKDDSF